MDPHHTASALGLPLGQTHKPNPRFNLFHIDSHDSHLDSFRVQIFAPNQKSLQSGLLHICARGVIFDCDQMETPLLKISYNAHQFTFETFAGEIMLQQAGQSPLFAQIIEVVQRQMPQIHLSSYLQEICVLILSVSGRSHSIARVKPSAPVSELGGTFIYLVNEDHARQQHLSFTLSHFCSHYQPDTSVQITLSEHQILKRYIELQVKKYVAFLDQNLIDPHTAVTDLKFQVTQVTIEGESVNLLLLRQ